MRVLLLGYSDIARRRVLPALHRCGVAHVDIASQGRAAAIVRPDGIGGHDFTDYHTALAGSDAALVWVSTVNARHHALALAALGGGRHVVIDKPATTRTADTLALADLARARGLIVAEATVWAFHPVVTAIRDLFAQAGSVPTHLVAAFSYPPLDADNFRHSAALGGGMVMDLGPYAMSLGRVFLGAAPDQVQVAASADDGGFSLVALYAGGRTVAGRFGTGTGYVNRLTLLGPRVAVDVERIFSPPPDLAFTLAARVDNQPVTVAVAAADSFALFFNAVGAAIANGDGAALAAAMVVDALAVDRLK